MLSECSFRLSLLALVLATACTSIPPPQNATPTPTPNSPAAIAQVSDDDYVKNDNGVIAGETLWFWLEDWEINRPESIEGRLIILQVNEGFAGIAYVTPDNKKIFTYVVPTDEWSMSRSNGLLETPEMVLDGRRMDAFLQRYDIDPRRDMIVFAMGESGGEASMLTARGWILFRYWGTAAEHLAILNGGIANVLDHRFLSSEHSTPSNAGTATVKSLPDDNTRLLVSVEDLFKMMQGIEEPMGVPLLWDVRSGDEYNGLQKQSAGWQGRSCGVKHEQQCYVAFEGHLAGARNLDYMQLLVTDDWVVDLNSDGVINASDASFRYRSKAALEALLSSLGHVPGDSVYTYSRTGFRAAVATIASGVILGNPTQLYDASWLEWGQLAARENISEYPNLPEDSPWRADIDSFSEVLSVNPSESVEVPAVVNPYAEGAREVAKADRRYKAE